MLRIFKLTTGNKYIIYKTYKDYGFQSSDKIMFMGKNIKFNVEESRIGEILFVGGGTAIGKGLQTYGDVHIGTNCHIKDHVTLDDDSFIENRVHIGNYSQIRTNSRIGRRCYIRDDVVIGYNVVLHDSVFVAKNSKIYHNDEILPFSNVYCIKTNTHWITVYFDGSSRKIHYIINRNYEIYDNLLSLQNALRTKPTRLNDIVQKLRKRHKL